MSELSIGKFTLKKIEGQQRIGSPFFTYTGTFENHWSHARIETLLGPEDMEMFRSLAGCEVEIVLVFNHSETNAGRRQMTVDSPHADPNRGVGAHIPSEPVTYETNPGGLAAAKAARADVATYFIRK